MVRSRSASSWTPGAEGVAVCRGTRLITGRGGYTDVPRKDRTIMKTKVLALFFALVCIQFCVHAQGLGSISGRVLDPNGAAVASARITVQQEGTGFSRSAVTDSDGLYVVPSLQPAKYSVSVEAPGFSALRQSGVELLADQSL